MDDTKILEYYLTKTSDLLTSLNTRHFVYVDVPSCVCIGALLERIEKLEEKINGLQEKG